MEALTGGTTLGSGERGSGASYSTQAQGQRATGVQPSTRPMRATGPVGRSPSCSWQAGRSVGGLGHWDPVVPGVALARFEFV